MRKIKQFHFARLVKSIGFLVLGLMTLSVASGQLDQIQAATTVPAITDDPNGTTEKAISKAVIVSAQLSATNAQGTISSQSSLNNGAGAIINSDVTSLNAVYTMKNTSDVAQRVDATIFLLPKYFEAATATSQITVADSATRSDFEQNLPTGLKVSYAVDNGNYKSFTKDWTGQTLLSVYPNFKWSDLKQFRVDGNLPAHSSHTWTIPLTVVKSDLYNLSGVDHVGAMNQLGLTSGDGNVAFRLATPLPSVTGQYMAVLVDQLGIKYHQVPAEIQALMPDATANEISYHNFYTLVGGSSAYNYTGGTVVVKLPATNIADLVKDKGYSLLLNQDGTPQSQYSYRSYSPSTSVTVTGNTPGTSAVASAGRQLAPEVYITLRKIVTAQDSTLTVGADWTKAANFVSGLDNQDQPLTVDQVTTTLIDPEGIVQNGRVTKAGIFKVMYAYQVAANYYGKNKPYVVSDTATVTVKSNPNQSVTTPTTPATPDKGTATPVVEDTPVTSNKQAKGNQVLLAKTGSVPADAQTVKPTTLPQPHFAKVTVNNAAATKNTVTLPKTGENIQSWSLLVGLGMLVGGAFVFLLKRRFSRAY